jgi:hypothetical protein
MGCHIPGVLLAPSQIKPADGQQPSARPGRDFPLEVIAWYVQTQNTAQSPLDSVLDSGVHIQQAN